MSSQSDHQIPAWVVRRSHALVPEPQDPSDGALRLDEQEEMPAALDHVEASVGQPGRQPPGVQHRRAWIVVPRDDERRTAVLSERFVDALKKADRP
jgi:hypothetical protein